MESVSLVALCDDLSITLATGKNWVRLGKLKPEYLKDGQPFFTPEYVSEIKQEISRGSNCALKSRRNKKYVTGNYLYKSYVSADSPNLTIVQNLLETIASKDICLTDELVILLVADCAMQLALGNSPALSLIEDFTYDLAGGIADRTALFKKNISGLFNLPYVYVPGEDTLGLVYLSCKNLSSRKASGSYYTPASVVKKLIDSLNIENGKNLLDPCLGTGNFLLGLPDNVEFINIFGSDIDETAVKIARINMALKYPDTTAAEIKNHIFVSDYPNSSANIKYEYIIGNPPWGYDYSPAQLENLRKRYTTAAGRGVESCSIFMEKALMDLPEGGKFSLVVPKALLTAGMHAPVRSELMHKGRIEYINYLENVFDGVQCPSIILNVQKASGGFDTKGIEVAGEFGEFTINTHRSLSAKGFSLAITDQEYLLLEELRKCTGAKTLKSNADFVLGIVTGNNRNLLSPTQKPGFEPILKGTDVFKFKAAKASNYIKFTPEAFQQCAPIDYYRAKEKLLYRFVCNRLVFAYDSAGTLTLNSCNIVIPRLEGLSMKYILAILNSRIAQFIYIKECASVKVLRSHIERIPIAVGTPDEQKVIEELTAMLVHTSESSSFYAKTEANPSENTYTLYNKLDRIIAGLYGLSDDEYTLICDVVDTKNPFFYA